MAVRPTKAAQTTVNTTLRDRGIAHAVYLERLKADVAQTILAELDDVVIPDLVERITSRLARIEARGFDIAPKETQRLKDMLEVMEAAVESWSTGLSTDLADQAVKIGTAEARWQDDLFTRTIPITWDTLIPPTAILEAAVLQSPIDGVLLADVVDRLSSATKTNLERAIRIGIAEGEGIDLITTRVKKATDLTRGSAEAVARTAVGHASNMGRAAYYHENSDIVKGVQWVATLDTRTCSSCQSLDGNLFPVDQGTRPPRHMNCRCTTVPVLKSMRELGLPLADYDPATRASMNGQVAGGTTYNEWLKSMPPSIQDEALGPTRGRLFRSGEINVTDFVDRGGDPYNLDELHKREKAAWKKAGL